MGEALEVKDMSRMLKLVMPSPRTQPPRPIAPHHLAPIEMMARSIQFQPGTLLNLQLGGNKPALAVPPSASVAVSIAPHRDPDPPLVLSFLIPAWAVPGGYTLCGLGLGLCNLIAPGYMQSCAHLLCPLWSLSIGLHILCVSQQPVSGEVWGWAGVLTLLLLPFVIMIAAPIFVGFYLLVFAAFASGMFWKHLHGAHFILLWFCWAGLVVACALSVGVQQPYMHLSVASFFSISIGVLNSGGCKCAVRVAWDGSPCAGQHV